MNRLEQQIARTSIRRRRVRSAHGASNSTSLGSTRYPFAAMVSIAHVNARTGREFRADRRQVHEVTARHQARPRRRRTVVARVANCVRYSAA